MRTFLAYNRTRGVPLASKVLLAGTFRARMKGLLGCKQLLQEMGLWIRPSQGVHTIGMTFPIDVAYLDRDGRILRLYHRLAPFRVAAISMRTRSVLELPAGTLSRTQTAVGDILDFQPVK